MACHPLHCTLPLSAALPTDRATLHASPPSSWLPSQTVWQALQEETRLWVLEGLVAVFSARAALLGSAPPQVVKLIGIVGGAKKKPEKKGWYTSGAYCEAVMKTTRRYQFIAVHGPDDGERLWQEWYKGCKLRAGASQSSRRSRPPPSRTTPRPAAPALRPPRPASHTHTHTPRHAKALPGHHSLGWLLRLMRHA